MAFWERRMLCFDYVHFKMFFINLLEEGVAGGYISYLEYLFIFGSFGLL